MTQRTDRIDALLREEIGELLSREVADPRIGFVTITDVETAPDLSHASVWVSIIGQPEEREASLGALRHALPFIRRQLGTRVRLRRIPELHLRLDDTAQRGTRVLQLLSELEAGREPEPDAPVRESLPTPAAALPGVGDGPDATSDGESAGAGPGISGQPGPGAGKRGRRGGGYRPRPAARRDEKGPRDRSSRDRGSRDHR